MIYGAVFVRENSLRISRVRPQQWLFDDTVSGNRVVQLRKRFSEALFTALSSVAIVLFHYRNYLDGKSSVAMYLDNTYFLIPIHHYLSKHFSLIDFPSRMY